MFEDSSHWFPGVWERFFPRDLAAGLAEVLQQPKTAVVFLRNTGVFAFFFYADPPLSQKNSSQNFNLGFSSAYNHDFGFQSPNFISLNVDARRFMQCRRHNILSNWYVQFGVFIVTCILPIPMCIQNQQQTWSSANCISVVFAEKHKCRKTTLRKPIKNVRLQFKTHRASTRNSTSMLSHWSEEAQKICLSSTTYNCSSPLSTNQVTTFLLFLPFYLNCLTLSSVLC